MVPSRLVPSLESTPKPNHAFAVKRRTLAATILAVVALFGSPPTRAQDGGQTPVFRARTELVRLDVSITDRQGRPVSDVRADEIQVLEHGQRRPVVLFRHFADARRLGAERRDVVFEELSRNAMPASGHLYVLVFDLSHIQKGREQRARLAAERFLSREMKQGDAVALFGLPGPGPVLNFTSDIAKARALLTELRGRYDRRAFADMREFDAYRLVRTGGGRAVDVLVATRRPTVPTPRPVISPDGAATDVVARALASQVVSAADTENQVFLKQLAEVMRGLRAIEGRKAFVLFSQGFFVDNVAPQLIQVASAAAESHSVVFAIDLNTTDATAETGGVTSQDELAERREPLALLASETNGSVVSGATNLDQALASVAAQTNDYYLVGFEPSATEAPHDYHRVKVTVAREGLVVRARTGYSTVATRTAQTDRQAVDVALAVPRTAAALPIHYTTYQRGGPTPGKPRVIASLTAHVPRTATTVADAAHAEVIFIVRDAKTGQAVSSGTDQVRVEPVSDKAPGALAPVRYSVQFDLAPGEYWMRVLVREPGGVIGTADRRFHVWPITGAGVSTSDLIVSRLQGTRFDPPASAAVTRADQVLAYLELYGSSDLLQSTQAQVEVVRASSNDVVATVQPTVKAGSRGEWIVRATLPVAALAEGTYAARVRVSAPNQPLRTVVRNFRVVPEGGEGSDY